MPNKPLTQPEIDQRIKMRRSVRDLTILLGKLGFKKFIVDNDENMRQLGILTNSVMPRPPWPTGKSYGIGLKEAKDAVEAYLDRK